MPTLVQWDSNPNPRRTRAYQIAGERFGRLHPGVHVHYEPVGMRGYRELLLGCHAMLPPPDVVDVWSDWLGDPALVASLVNLDPVLDRWDRSADYHPIHRLLGRSAGETRALIVDLFLQGTHFRADLVDRLGLESPAALDRAGRWDWAAFERTARALHDPAHGVVGLSMRGGQGAELTVLNLMVTANDGNWFVETGACLLSSASAIEALDGYAALYRDLGICQSSAPDDGYLEFASHFYEGRAAMMLHNDDGINALNWLGRSRYATAAMPRLGGASYIAVVGFGLAVPLASPQRDLASDYSCYFTENYVEHYLQAQEEAGDAERVVTGAPMVSDHDRALMRDPLYEPFYRALNDSPSREFYNPIWLPGYARLTTGLVAPDFARILRGELSAERAAHRWAAAFDDATTAAATSHRCLT